MANNTFNSHKFSLVCPKCGELKPSGLRQTYCRTCHTETAREWRDKNPEKLKKINLRHNLKTKGITESQYQKLLDEQKGQCAICGQGPGPKCKQFSVDHDHACCPTDVSCGKCVRGLLCNSCNLGLSNFRDCPKSLIRAFDYLNRYNGAIS